MAYLGFSQHEGFGWAVADALQYSRAIVARAVGVMSYPDLQQSGFFPISDRWEFDWSQLDALPAIPGPRDLRLLSPSEFRRRLAALIDDVDSLAAV